MLTAFATFMGAIAPLVSLVNTGAGAALKAWADKKARANAPDMIAAKEAQVQQTATDNANADAAQAMNGGTPEERAAALERVRKEDA